MNWQIWIKNAEQTSSGVVYTVPYVAMFILFRVAHNTFSTHSRSYTLIGQYYHGASVNVTIMVSNNCPIIAHIFF